MFNSGAYVEDVDIEAARDPKRRKLIHHASKRVTGRAAADQELIVSLSNELDSAMRQLQESNVALDICQQRERIEEQERVLQATTARLEEREKIVHDLTEINEINRLLIARYQENSRSSRDRRRYTDQIECLEQQLEDLRLEYEVANS